jgi:TonB-linked SusC/RagA family outer membrane protein
VESIEGLRLKQFLKNFKLLQFMQLFIAKASASGIVRKPAYISKSNLIFIMRVSFLAILFVLLSFQLLLAKNTAGQSADDTFITLELKNVSLTAAFKKIEKMTDYLFAYQPRQVTRYDDVSLPRATRSVSGTLEILLKNTGLSFKQAGNSIIIFRTDDKMSIAVTTENVTTGLPADTTISGVVTNAENNQPLENVSVRVKGTTIGTATNGRGEFKLQLDNLSGVLVFSSIGYEEQEVRLDGKRTFSISLKQSDKKLDEVVVIGYGTRLKKDLTGTVNSLGSSEIVKARATNTQEAMQGRLPGVDIKRSSGKPGADFSIEIRGANSITGSTQPLYVIDGIPVGQNGAVSNPINDINPADIERIDILKDASSTAIYGSRGANGVVIITTKRGSRGGVKIVYDGYYGKVNPYHIPPVMDGPTFVTYAKDYFNALAGYPATPVPNTSIFSATELANIANGTYTDWIDLIKRNAGSMNHNLSISGGDEKSSYFISAGYQVYQGGTGKESTKKYTLKAGLDKTVKAFKFGASVYSTFADIDPGSGEVFRSAYRLRPTGSAYNPDGTERFFVYESEAQITNPLFEFRNEIRRQQYVHVLPNVFAEVTLIKGLKLRTSFSPDISFQRQGQYNDTYSKQQLGTRPNSGASSSNQYVNYTWDNVLTYNNQIGRSKFDVTLGNTWEYHQQDGSSISVQGLPFRSLWYNLGTAAGTVINGTPATLSVNSFYSRQNIVSAFARANYSFKDRYLLTATIRTDKNSIFAPGRQTGYFPSGALAWIVSEEDFLKNVTLIDQLKLRLSFGKSGNAALSNILFPYVTQANIYQTLYDFNGTGANGFGPNFGNQDLTWEKTDEYTAGIDLSLLKNRIGLQFDFYRKTSKGSILSRQIPLANGFPATTTNLGSVRNQGIEITLNTVNIKSGKFSWTTNINFAKNKNSIVDLYGDGKDDIGNGRFLGKKTRVVYSYKILGVWQTSEAAAAAAYGRKPGQYKLQDINKDSKIDANDRQILGSNIPDWFGGLTNNINYGNFDFSFTLYTRQGTFENSVFLEQVMNGDQGRARFGAFDRSYWTPTNPSNKWANEALDFQDGTARPINQFQNSSYFKISNITLGYTVPHKVLDRARISNLRVYVNAFNPFIWSKFIGWDPENPEGSSFLNQDFRTRTFTFGINLTL